MLLVWYRTDKSISRRLRGFRIFGLLAALVLLVSCGGQTKMKGEDPVEFLNFLGSPTVNRPERAAGFIEVRVGSVVLSGEFWKGKCKPVEQKNLLIVCNSRENYYVDMFGGTLRPTEVTKIVTEAANRFPYPSPRLDRRRQQDWRRFCSGRRSDLIHPDCRAFVIN